MRMLYWVDDAVTFCGDPGVGPVQQVRTELCYFRLFLTKTNNKNQHA